MTFLTGGQSKSANNHQKEKGHGCEHRALISLNRSELLWRWDPSAAGCSRCPGLITNFVHLLLRRSWRSQVGRGEVKKLRHVRLGSVALVQVGQTEPLFHEFKD